MRKISLVLLTLCCMLCGACGSTTPEASNEPPPDEPNERATSEGATSGDIRWVAGTPEFMLGEGYCGMNASADSAAGPWSRDRLIVLAGETLAPGQVHRVRIRVEQDPPGTMDSCGDTHHVVEILESVAGGPATAVYPGVGAAGLALTEAANFDREAEMGPFMISPQGIRFHPADVGDIRVGEQTLARGATIDQVVAAFEGCEQQAVRGGTVYRCDGAIVSLGGPTDAPEAVEINIVTRPDA